MPKSAISWEKVSENMHVAGIPGLVFCLIENHQIKETYAVGLKNTETKEPMSEHTVLQAASLSKPVFAYGVLLLQHAGKIDLDKPLHDYLPLPEADDTPQLQRITARQILTHKTGLQNWRFNSGDAFTFAFAPGTGFSYSGEGFFYLQRVLEAITGQSVESFMQEQVLRPFAMNNSSYLWRAEHESLISMGHQQDEQPISSWNAWQGRTLLTIASQWQKPLEKWLYADFVSALPQIHADLAPLPNNMIPNVAGSLLTTAPEFAQFLLHLLDTHNEIATQMLVPHHILNNLLAWGLGIGLEMVNGDPCFWHWGQTGGFESFMWGNPATGQGIVILTNANKGLKVCERLVRMATGHDLAAFLWL